MPSKTNIPYADISLNYWKGCTPKSEGCANCYACEQCHIRASNPKVMDQFTGLVKKTKTGKRIWTGELKRNPNALERFKQMKSPKTVFVNTLSDFFHKDVPFEWQRDLWQVFEERPQHRYLIFTKWPERVREVIFKLGLKNDMSNIWVIVSIENQRRFNERMPFIWEIYDYLNIGVSFEPLLEDIYVGRSFGLSTKVGAFLPYKWAIIGGESGHNARECSAHWIYKLISQHERLNVPVYVKQMGTHIAKSAGMKDRKGENPIEWGEMMRVRQFPWD